MPEFEWLPDPQEFCQGLSKLKIIVYTVNFGLQQVE